MREMLRRLAAKEPVNLPFISAYINLEPELEAGLQAPSRLKQQANDQAPKKSWRRHADETRRYRSGVTELRSLLEEKSKLLPERGPERDSFEADSKKLHEYIEHGYDTSARGAAIFACAGEDYWEVVEMPVPVETELLIDRKPCVGQLAFIDDNYDCYALCLADSVTARIYVVGLAKPEQEETVEGEPINHTMVGGWSQRRIQQRIENAVSDHTREVVQKLEKIVFDEDIPWIIFGGDPIAKTEFDRYLSDQARQRLIETNNMDTDLPEKEALEQSHEIMRQAERENDQEITRLAIEEAQGQGLGLKELNQIIIALRNGAVDRLILDTGWEGADIPRSQVLSDLHLASGESDMVSENGSDGNEPDWLPEGEAMHLREELITAAIRMDSRVEFVEDSPELAEVGGVAALLRWRPGELPGGVDKPENPEVVTTSHKRGERL